MATTTAAFHGSRDTRHIEHRSYAGQAWFTQVKNFFTDLGEDLLSTPKQMRGETKTDLFHKHLNALAISYFALIVLLLAASVPVLAYLIAY
ncbi:MAG TPA: hypothetical protein VHZ28_11380 [Terracidiphilus sp.]|jgi:hypothetical protein|nr:hypothetical protein [Terracidiphilus sp.]